MQCRHLLTVSHLYQVPGQYWKGTKPHSSDLKSEERCPHWKHQVMIKALVHLFSSHTASCRYATMVPLHSQKFSRPVRKSCARQIELAASTNRFACLLQQRIQLSLTRHRGYTPSHVPLQ